MLRTCLAPSLLRLLPSSAISRRCLPVIFLLPPRVSPFYCLYVFPRPLLIGSSFALIADQVCFRPSRRASPPFKLIREGQALSPWGVAYLTGPVDSSRSGPCCWSFTTASSDCCSCHCDCFILSRESPTDPVHGFRAVRVSFPFCHVYLAFGARSSGTLLTPWLL